jgi:uncharacterized protein (UPF0335 family)
VAQSSGNAATANVLCTAVDDRPRALTLRARAPKAHRTFCCLKLFQECPMATAAAVKDEATAHRFAKDHLKAFVERVERLEEEKKALSDDIRDVYSEAKANGFDVKALRTVVRLRKQDVEERKEQEAILETYLQALGMLN